MEIKELKERIEVIENTLHSMLLKLENDSGCEVEHIGLERFSYTMLNGSRLYRVHLHVGIDGT